MRETSTEKEKNYYDVLEITSGANQEEIYHGYIRAKNAYSQESLALYSLMTSDECSSNLRQIEEAYSVLGDPKKRSQYDEIRGIAKPVQRQPQQQFNAQSYASKLTPHLDNPFTASPREEESRAAVSNSLGSLQGQSRMQPEVRQTNITKLVTSKKFQLEYEVNSELENEIENAVEFSGAFLKKVREYRNVTIDRLADMTRISRSYLSYIETETFEKLPAAVYVRGFVFQYAKCLKMNPDIVAASYLARMKRLQEGKK